MMFLTLLAAQAALALPPMKMSRNGDGHVLEIGAFDPMMIPAIETEIDRRATALCAGKKVSWGRFALDENLGKVPGISPAKVKFYRREFACVAADPRTYAAAPTDWVATAGDDAAVRRIFETYYGKRDGGDFAGAHAMLRPEIVSPLATWIKDQQKHKRQLGKGSRRLTKVTWYVNPEASDRPGVYAAIDFVGDYAGAHLYCGYVILYRLSAADYEIVREEQNLFVKSAEAPNPGQLAAIRAATCRE